MTNIRHRRSSLPRASFAITAGVAIALAGFHLAIAKQLTNTEMKQLPTTLWQTIDLLVEQIRFRRTNVEGVLDVTLFDSDPRQFVIQPSFQSLEGGPVRLADGVVMESIDLRVRPERASHPGFLGLRVAGTCIRLDVVRARYGTLSITDYPRGRSWDEVTSHTTIQPWGRLSFSFAERNPDCLSSVVLRPKDLSR